MLTVVMDHEGRRSGIERRQFSYLVHVPERRSGKDRRNGLGPGWDIGFDIEEENEDNGFYPTDLFH